ncbi:MAG: cytoplasmic protein [Deltaproteobacteria bacterium]|nr:MAG: cytoplasmic protein [Deltaproteobacteria bacterium]
MSRHRHDIVDTYQGLMAFGFSREEDERSLIVFMQKFSDDDMMKLICSRLSDEEIGDLVDQITGLMKTHLTEEEYHRYFLKD